MIGLIQKLVLAMVAEMGGIEAVHEVKRRTGIPEDFEFRIDTDYDDTQMNMLLANACDVLKVSEDAALKAFSAYFLRDIQARFPVFLARAQTSRDFLLQQTTIHNMLGSGLRNAEKLKAINDKFSVEKLEGGDLQVYYKSKNQWCTLYRELVYDVAKLYQENLSLTTTQCRKRGDERCAFRLHWNDNERTLPTHG